MDEHLTRDLFRAIHKGWRNPGDLAAIAMAHLFELCPRCRQEFESWRDQLGEGVATPEGQDYDAVFDRVRAPAAANDGDGTALEARVDAERREARSRAEKLLALPPEQRLDWIRNETARHSGVLLAEVLIEESRRRTPGYPHEGQTLAHLARVVLQHAPTSAYAVELYARALAYLANAIRVIGDLPRAEQIFADARYFVRLQGGGDRLVRAELDGLEGSLHSGQGRHEEAIRILLRAFMTWRLERHSRNVAAILLKLSGTHYKMGACSKALELLDEAETILDQARDRRLWFIVQRNRALYLSEQGDVAVAREVFESLEERFPFGFDPMDELRRGWTEFRLLRASGERDAAESRMREVRSQFSLLGMTYDAALASVELLDLVAEQGRMREVEEMAAEILPVFERLRVVREMRKVEALRATSRRL